jgi:Ran GTPase-activating protein (RanGAP) involved in mRNA processing and transport
MQHLTHLRLSRNDIQFGGCLELADALAHGAAPALRVFDLYNNPELCEEGPSRVGQALAAMFPHVPHLTELHLGSTGFTDSNVASLSAGLPLLPELTTLTLRDNLLQNAGAAALTRVLPHCVSLHLLNIENNYIEGFEASPATPLGALVAAAAALPDCRVEFGDDRNNRND